MKTLRAGASALAICTISAGGFATAQTAQTPVDTTPQAGVNATQGAPTITGTAPGTVGAGAAQGEQTPGSEGHSIANTTNPATSDGGPAAGEIVVTGIRASLANAQSIKRNSDTVVDAITANDIGALPDRSVTEALQRVPGVSISRFAGSNDPDHFSVEGSGVVVRGLNFVRSEFNGRDTFSAGIGGQSINFSDVPSELLGSVEVYKNVTAEMIEGGLAGTVNLNTRLPLDNKGFHIGYDAEGNYGDFEKKWSPTGSFLISNTWDTGVGRFGLLADVSYSELKSRSDGIQVTNIQTRDGRIVNAANSTSVTICRSPLPGDTDTTTLPAAGGGCSDPSTPGADGFADPADVRYAPLGGQFRTQDYDRKRNGIALTGQWESNDRRALLTGQFLRTHSSNAWGEHTFESAPDLADYNTYPAGCLQNADGPPTNGNTTTRGECPVGSFQNYQYDSNGLFEKGYITLPGTGWRNSSSGSIDSTVPTGGQQQSLSRRQVDETSTVSDYGLNFKFNPSDHWQINLDGDYTKAEHNELDMSTFGSTFADQEVDLTGSIPVVIPHKPLTLAAGWATPNPELANATDAQYFADENVQFWRAAMDHIEHSTGDEKAFKADVAYKFDDGSFLKRIKFGGRYADREETVRYTAYNWGAISEIWSGTPVSIAEAGDQYVNFYQFPNFFRGKTSAPPGAYYYNGDLIKGYQQAASILQSFNDIWHNDNGATATNRWTPAAGRDGVIPGTDYLPSEIQQVSDKDKNAYVMLSFGSSDPIFGNVKIDGNIGVRYVDTRIRSSGSIGVQSQSALGIQDPYSHTSIDPTTGLPVLDGRCDPQTPVATPDNPHPTPQKPTGVCNLTPQQYADLQTFATGTSVDEVVRNDYHYWLPSFNMKVGLSDKFLLRFAASKVLTRPDLGNIRDYLLVGLDANSGLPTATAGNPNLKPATAWQFDATAEWYFAKVGSLTFDAFYKSVKNFFYSATVDRAITNNGITETVTTRIPENYTGAGKIKGFEVAYQQTFDFLPGALNGIGVNANYSYIKSSGLPNSFLNGGNPDSTSTIAKGNLPLEGLSKHNVNAEIFYEKGPISLRAAYNWRSKYLLTAADVIYPYTSIYQGAAGQLDASAFLSLNKYIKIGVQGVNLTDSTTKTYQAYKDGSTDLAPRSYFINDRRYSFIVRGQF